MDYDFVKLSDVPVAEDGATHVLGTKVAKWYASPHQDWAQWHWI